ncbi:MAG: hypothetical protein RI947_1062 [Candidatus Parcubacteria bacterium]|jgi:nitrogen fixation NifU-like protein
MSSIYQDIILDHYRNPRNNGHLARHTHKVTVNNPLCGDLLTFEIYDENGIVKEIAFSGSGCAISQASASMLTEYAVGKSNDELKKIDKDIVLEMLGIELSPNRIKCALLSLEGLHKLLAK